MFEVGEENERAREKWERGRKTEKEAFEELKNQNTNTIPMLLPFCHHLVLNSRFFPLMLASELKK